MSANGAMGRLYYCGPIELFYVPVSAHNMGCGMCYPVCEMVHIKDPLLLDRKVTQELAAGFFSLSI